PVQDPTKPAHVEAREGGVPFPYWNDDIKWQATGVRRDTLGGRHATTVFYDSATGQRVAYTVVSIPALRVPAGQRVGKRVVVLRQGGSTIVTWGEHGQTCLISTRSRPGSAAMLVWLAQQEENA